MVSEWYETRYFRLAVDNKRNREAKSVEVICESLIKISGMDRNEIKDFLPLNLKWSHFGVLTISIPAKTMRHCDIFHVVKNRSYYDKDNYGININELMKKRGVEDKACLLSFDKAVRAFSLDWLQGPGKYELTLKVTAEKAKAQKYRIIIEHTGKWENDIPETNVEIKPV